MKGILEILKPAFENTLVIPDVKPAWVSECCEEEDRATGSDGPDYSDLGICPRCHDNCVFVSRARQ